MSIYDKAKTNAHVIRKGSRFVCCTTVKLDDADFQEAKASGDDPNGYILHQTKRGCAGACDCGGFPATGRFLDDTTSYAECEQDPSQLVNPRS